MKGDFLKLFAFLGSKQSDNKRRARPPSIACPREAVRQIDTGFSLHSGLKNDGVADKQMRYPHTLPHRRRAQSLKRDRSLSVSGTATGRVHNFGTQIAPRKPSENSSRKTTVNIDIASSIIVKDFEIEDIRQIWRTFKDNSIFNETSVQEGLLTTTLCSTEL